ncbi:MAG TPA: hypothetical protein DCR40_12515 [Prolixibacteraceae bacterium]|nr:hypothetical protein [Prolixibacteraceae bacterium]
MKFGINIEDLKKLISESKIEKIELGKIINPILEKYDLEKKEILEVCQIGKFVYRIDSGIQIIDKPKPPAPDFIIKYNATLIGLEHTRILTKDASKYLKIVSLLDFAKKIYSIKYPNANVLATISIKNDKLDYRKNEKADLAKEIADLVYAHQSNGSIVLPDFITKIRTTRHSQITFNYSEKNWESKYLTRERLKEEIQKKEQKIKEYKKSKLELSEIWLVLLIGSLNSVSFRLNDKEKYETCSEFDRVYLKTDFDDDIIRIK